VKDTSRDIVRTMRMRAGVLVGALGLAVVVLGAAPPVATAPAAASKPWTPPVFTEQQKERDAMVKHIKDYYGMTDAPTLAALTAVPRHEFVPEDLQAQAYDDSPLPIAYGQLISQPCIVGQMTEKLKLTPKSKVLEIGTGSGYQGAILTHLTSHVYSIEIIKPLGEAAAARFKRLGYTTIQTRIADGFNGWPEEAPFDAIIVTCAAGQIPPPLIKQLAPGGVMMIPVGQPFAMQSLMQVTKDADGTVRSKNNGNVRFVPLLQSDPTTQAASTPATAPK
jgi:protein-L-isoaspartate(D-aspartate) O-methyltransferase